MAARFSALSSDLGTIDVPFGPQADGSFSAWLVLAGIDPQLRAPCDTQAWVVTDAANNRSLLMQIQWPKMVRDALQRAGLRDTPTYLALRYDDFDYVAVTPSFLPDYLSQPPRTSLLDSPDPPPLEDVRTKIVDGTLAIGFASGQPIGTLKASARLHVKVLTTSRIAPRAGSGPIGELSGRNLFDPAAFWFALWQLGTAAFKSDADVAALSTWKDRNLAALQRIVIEIRDEYNTPISSTGALAGRISTALQPSGQLRGSGAYHGYFVATSSQVSLSLATVRTPPGTGPVMPILEEDLVFFDVGSGDTIYDGTVEPIALVAPGHAVIQACRPAAWFEPQQASNTLEFQAASQSASQPLSRYSRGNDVQLLIDGRQYYQLLVDEIRQIDPISAADFFHIAAWSIQIDFPLSGTTRPAADSPSLRQSLEDKGERVRALIFENPIDFGPLLYDTEPAVEFMNTGAQLIRALHLDRQAGLNSADHMKIVVINAASGVGLVAYCGGIDVSQDRITDATHRESANPHFFFPDGLHDTMLRVRGVAATELNLVLYKRWLDHALIKPEPAQADFNYAPYDGLNDEGPALCQVAMTIDHRLAEPYGFAPNGDGTLRATLLRAIGNSRQYIYVEDQFFRDATVIQALNVAAGRGVKVLIVVPRKIWDPKALAERFEELVPGILENDECFNDTAREIAQPLLTNLQNIAMYFLVVPPEDIYVHSKLMAIDDIFVSCGSANLDIRGLGPPAAVAIAGGRDSLTVSNECNVFAIDTRVSDQGTRTLVRDFRVRLWAEHLFRELIPVGKDVASSPSFETLVDPLLAISRYWNSPASTGGRIQRLQISP